jgi:hypothetical protein
MRTLPNDERWRRREGCRLVKVVTAGKDICPSGCYTPHTRGNYRVHGRASLDYSPIFYQRSIPTWRGTHPPAWAIAKCAFTRPAAVSKYATCVDTDIESLTLIGAFPHNTGHSATAEILISLSSQPRYALQAEAQ